MVLVTNEDEHERDRVKVPRLHQNGGHHQPAHSIAFGIVFGHEMPDGTVHHRLLRHCYRHLGLSHTLAVICCTCESGAPISLSRQIMVDLAATKHALVILLSSPAVSE